jgi:hypothetical protein
MTTSDVALSPAILGGSALLIAFGHRIPGVPDLLRPDRAEELRDAWRQPIRGPRFTNRTIMIVVAVATLFSIFCTAGSWTPPRTPGVLPEPRPTGIIDTRIPEIEGEDGEPEPPFEAPAGPPPFRASTEAVPSAAADEDDTGGRVHPA